MNEQLGNILAQYQHEAKEIANVDEPVRTLILFRLGEQNFALYGQQVKEILADRPVSWLPGCPPMLEGVINNRGRVESVIRLNSLVESDEPEAAAKRVILIGRSDTMQSGILVDKLIDVLDVAESQIQCAPDSLSEVMQKIVSGVVNIAESWYAILDLNLVFERFQEACGYDVSR